MIGITGQGILSYWQKRPIFWKKLSIGEHGFDPQEEPDMRATFIAWGPGIQSGKIIKAFKNTEVYPLAARLLGLQIHEPLDGKGILIKSASVKKLFFVYKIISYN